MAQPPSNGNKPLPEAIVQDFLKLEHSKVNLKAEELKIKAKEIDANERLAKASMEFQFKLQEKAPKQHKETTIVYASCISGILIIFLGFLGYMVTHGQLEFVKELLGWLGYLFALFIGFLGGRATKPQKKEDSSDKSISDAEVIE
jgi:cation transport ATPase